MENWWENDELYHIQQECDRVSDAKDMLLTLKMSEDCFKLGHDASLDPMLRANYLYCSGTCLLGVIYFGKEKEKEEIEEYYEKCLYLFRTAKDYCINEYNNISFSDDEYMTEKAHIDGLHFQLIVNYGNVLSQCGRYVKSINNLNSILEYEYPMAIGNLALKIVDYSYYDLSHRKIMLYQAFQMIGKVLDKNVFFPEREYAQSQLLDYSERIKSYLGEEYLSKQYSLDDFLEPFDGMSDEELAYRRWFAKKGLALNQLNEIFFDTEVGYDPLHLPSLTESVNSSIIPRYHGLFNQIKQEYTSARFLIYEGLTDRSVHYSDKMVYMVNTFDYPVYGVGIEKIKAAYRAIYSIFDKIAYFLNKYFELKIPDHLISFHNFWYKKNKGKQVIREEVLNLKDENYNLQGLWWIYKDLRNKAVYKNKHIDPILKKITQVRNAMEHRYLKILDYFDSTEVKVDKRMDDLAYIISFEEFEKLTIELLKLTREAIIQLTMIIQVEEDKKDQIRKEHGSKLGHLSLSEYDDGWKQIW